MSGRVKASVIPSADGEQIGRFIRQFISPDARIMSDDDKAIGKAAKAFLRSPTPGAMPLQHGCEGTSALLKRVQLGVYHQLSKRHLQRYIEEIVFRKNQRRMIETVNQRDGTVQVQIYHRPFLDQLEDLLVRAIGRQVRRPGEGGLEWPKPIAAGYVEAPSGASS